MASCTLTVIPCDCEGCNTRPAAADSDACAYILRESIPLLSAQNQLNMCYSHLYEYFNAHGLADNFVASLDKYTGKGSDFSAMQKDTAPILIIIGDNTCYGTLRYFGRALAESLAERGQCVITSAVTTVLSMRSICGPAERHIPNTGASGRTTYLLSAHT